MKKLLLLRFKIYNALYAFNLISEKRLQTAAIEAVIYGLNKQKLLDRIEASKDEDYERYY